MTRCDYFIQGNTPGFCATCGWPEGLHGLIGDPSGFAPPTRVREIEEIIDSTQEEIRRIFHQHTPVRVTAWRGELRIEPDAYPEIVDRREEIRRKVMERVVITGGGCWIWMGPCSGNGRGGGYPRMHLDGQTMAVHKVMWTNEHGIIPGKKQLDHVCRNRLCVRPHPDHLELVTHRQNQKRRASARKERNP